MKQEISAKMVPGILVLIALLLVVLFLSVWVVKILLYVPQTVEITRVDILCSINRSRNDNRIWTSNCRKLEGRGLMDGFVRDTFVSFTYTSPADGRPYRGMMQRALNDDGQPIKVADRIVVEASRLVPETYTDWWSANMSNDRLADDAKIH